LATPTLIWLGPFIQDYGDFTGKYLNESGLLETIGLGIIEENFKLKSLKN